MLQERPSVVPSVQDVVLTGAQGPWNTKSDGILMMLFQLPIKAIRDRFLRYEPEEVERLFPNDVRGLRVYTIRDLAKGKVGGTEWHRIRQEMVFVLDGSVRWICADLYGGIRHLILDSGYGVSMPPFILHTYEVREAGSGLLVVANTLFDPEDPATHDTYPMEAFHQLRDQMAQPTGV